MSEPTITLSQAESIINRAVSRIVANGGKKWLTMAQACEHANCSQSKLRQLIEAKIIVASNYGIRGATVSISRESIDKYHESKIYNPDLKKLWLKK